MRAIIAGGTGFIGRALVDELRGSDWEIVVLSRSPIKVAEIFGPDVVAMGWESDDWQDMLGPDTVIVNLAGESIAEGRWSAEKKQRILESRVQAGERIVAAVQQAGVLPGGLIQGSAVGFYGPRETKLLDEKAPSGEGFLAEVVRQWEASTLKLEEMGVRRVIVRTGVVLGQGGALEKMLPPFKMFLGGPLGNGFQGMSWIHMADQVGAIRFLMENESARGVFNLTAPTPVRSRKFARILGQTLGKPYKLRTPAFVIRLLFGEMADEVLLSGQLVVPDRLEAAGYTFRFTELGEALKDILQ
jgi:hypothetical protein